MKFEGGLGIKAVTTWIPDTRQTAEEAERAGLTDEGAAERQGVTELPYSTDLAAPEMAVLAGRRALERAGLGPERIGLLAHAWIYHQGREKWSPAHFVADGLGLPPTALPFGLQELCSGGTTGLFMAAAHLLARPEVEAALVTTADRFGGPIWNRWRMHPDIGYGDGATAALLHRRDGTPDELLLLSLTHSTATFLEGMERGNAPFSTGLMVGRATLETADARREFYDKHGRESFREAALVHVRASLQQALEEAGLYGDDPRIRFVTMPRMGPRLVDLMYLTVLQEDLKADIVHLGGRTGHLGAGDMIANMADVVQQGMLRSGEIAVIAGAGGGFTWSTAVVQAP